jgi:hypothetical protein
VVGLISDNTLKRSIFMKHQEVVLAVILVLLSAIPSFTQTHSSAAARARHCVGEDFRGGEYEGSQQRISQCILE